MIENSGFREMVTCPRSHSRKGTQQSHKFKPISACSDLLATPAYSREIVHNRWPMGVEAHILLPELNSTLGTSEMAARTNTESMDRRKAPQVLQGMFAVGF